MRCTQFNVMVVSLMLLPFSFVKAQNEYPEVSSLSGVLRDHNTKEPVPYANIFIDGSNVGTSSSETGAFHLVIPTTRLEYLKISSIGYSTMRLRIDSLQSIGSPVIYLKTSIIQLDEVLVQASKVSASDLVREAIHSLAKNTYPEDYVLEWYSTMVSTDSATDLDYSMETVFDDYHIGNNSKQTIRHQRELGISPVLLHNPKDTLCALVPWFDLSFAEVRHAKYGVLSLNNIEDFAFVHEGVLGLDEDSVYVIGYEAINRRYQVTGSTNKKISYRGRLYINTNSHAILRHTLEMGTNSFITFEVLYKKTDGYYFPYYLKTTRNLDISRNFQPFLSVTYILQNLTFVNVEYEAGYNWCDNRAPYDENFWNSHHPRE